MRIYIAHSKDFDYKNDLYLPLRQSELSEKHEIILPHEESASSSNTRDFYRSIDVMIAECSCPATGLGIELGWVYDDNIPIYCIYRKGKKYSGSIKSVTSNIIEYEDVSEMLKTIENIIAIEEKKRQINKLVPKKHKNE